MAPGCSENSDHFRFVMNRHSPRILNKTSVKFDISTINNKIGFMTSLCLRSIDNSKLGHSKINWEVLQPKNSLPLKECKVMIESISDSDNPSQNHIKYYSDEMKENYVGRVSPKHCLDYRNNNNSVKEKGKNALVQNVQRKRKRNSITKIPVTFKIGPEVMISKKPCKKKYLQRPRQKKRKMSKVHNQEQYKNYEEIDDTMQVRKEVEADATDSSQNSVEKSDSETERKVRLATALVQIELERRILQLQTNTDDEDEFFDAKSDDAVVPGDRFEIDAGMKEADDTTKALLHPNLEYDDEKRENYEIITIDDENDVEDDCVIINEQLCHSDNLNYEEESYDIRVLDEHDMFTETLNTRESVDVYRMFSSSLINQENDHRPKERERNL